MLRCELPSQLLERFGRHDLRQLEQAEGFKVLVDEGLELVGLDDARGVDAPWAVDTRPRRDDRESHKRGDSVMPMRTGRSRAAMTSRSTVMCRSFCASGEAIPSKVFL